MAQSSGIFLFCDKIVTDHRDGTVPPHRLTSGDNSLQPDDVRVVKLPHDRRLRQEVSPLLVRVARLQAFNGHVHFSLSVQTQSPAAHLAKLSYTANRQGQRTGVRVYDGVRASVRAS